MKADIKKIVLPVLVLILLAGYWTYHEPQECCNCHAQIDSLEKRNQQASEEKIRLDKQILDLKRKADSLSRKAKTEHNLVTSFKKQQHEKVSSIDTLTLHELVGFFTKLKTDSACRK